MILMFVPSRLSLILLPPETSGGQGHLQARPKRALILQHCDDRPGFWDKTPYRQWRLIEQRHEDQVPAPAKDTHQPQAGGTPHPWRLGDQGCDVWYRASRDRLLRFAPDRSAATAWGLQRPATGVLHGRAASCGCAATASRRAW